MSRCKTRSPDGRRCELQKHQGSHAVGIKVRAVRYFEAGGGWLDAQGQEIARLVQSSPKARVAMRKAGIQC